jgi:hypothetical protein
MIIIENKNMENSVYFPQNIYTSNTDIYTVVLFDRATNRKYTFSGLDDKHLVQFSFYTFFIDFTNIPEGEYEYSIIDSNSKTVGTGLIRLNDLIESNVIYNDPRTYIAYDKQ